MATIDDLPINNNERWAQDQKALESGPKIQEGRHVVGQAQVDVTEPSYPSAVDALIGQDKTILPWAMIAPPPESISAKPSNLFKDELMPRLGDNPKLELIKTRLQSLPVTYNGK